MAIVSGSIATTPGCSWLDSLWMGHECQQALEQGFYDTGPGDTNKLIITNPPGAGSVPTDILTSNDPEAILQAQSDSSYQAFGDWQKAVTNTNWGVSSSSTNWIPWAVAGVFAVMFVGKAL